MCKAHNGKTENRYFSFDSPRSSDHLSFTTYESLQYSSKKKKTQIYTRSHTHIHTDAKVVAHYLKLWMKNEHTHFSTSKPTNQPETLAVHWKTACVLRVICIQCVQHAAMRCTFSKPLRNLKRNKMNNAPFAYKITMAGELFHSHFIDRLKMLFRCFRKDFPFIVTSANTHTHTLTKSNVIAVMFHMLRKMCMCHINRIKKKNTSQ